MQASVEKIWESAQQSLRTMLNPDIYNLWFLPVKAVALEEDTIVLEVANDFCEVWLKDNYLGLDSAMFWPQASGQILKIKFRVGDAPAPAASPARSRRKPEPRPIAEPSERAAAPGAKRPSTRKTPSRPLWSAKTTITPTPPPWPWPRRPANPTTLCFFYGGVGLGKTHLLHAIGQHVAAAQKSRPRDLSLLGKIHQRIH